MKGLIHRVSCVLGLGGLLGTFACGSDGNPAAGTNAGGAGGAGATGGSGGASGAAADDAGVPKPTPVVDQIANVVAWTLSGSEVGGLQDGAGANARFNNPVNLVLAPDGNLIVADFDNGALRRITPAGVVTTLTSQAGFERPFGIAFTPAGDLLVQTDRNPAGEGDNTTGTLWRVDAATGVATVVKQDLGRPRGLAMLDPTHVLLSDVAVSWLLKMDLTTGTATVLAGASNAPGFKDGAGSSARFNGAYGVAVLPDGNFVVADLGNHAIRIVTPSGGVTTLAGNGSPGMVDGDLKDARFDSPRDVAVDAAGNVYVSDNGNQRIRRIDVANAKVQTVAGDGTAGYRDGPGGVAQFFGQEGIDVSADGTTVYVADGNGGEPLPYHRVRRIQLP